MKLFRVVATLSILGLVGCAGLQAAGQTAAELAPKMGAEVIEGAAEGNWGKIITVGLSYLSAVILAGFREKKVQSYSGLTP